LPAFVSPAWPTTIFMLGRKGAKDVQQPTSSDRRSVGLIWPWDR
jgi:hypothetical protein